MIGRCSNLQPNWLAKYKASISEIFRRTREFLSKFIVRLERFSNPKSKNFKFSTYNELACRNNNVPYAKCRFKVCWAVEKFHKSWIRPADSALIRILLRESATKSKRKENKRSPCFNPCLHFKWWIYIY